MIPHRRNKFVSDWFAKYMRYRIFKAFNRVVVTPFEPKEGHSILLLCNHFSWWDGFLANYLAFWHLKRTLFIMMQRDHLEKRMFFNLTGGFSIEKGARDMIESLNYAANLCNDPRNLVVVFPQGELISNHTTHIEIGQGIERLVKRIKGPCQIIYSCTLIDYFESLKPSAFIHLFDCGVAGEVPFTELAQRMNTFHQQALADQLHVEH
ncbi:lysophospholipid acyltransferase family protein [Mucilaginibacter daejeonensis]|uniref:lysophospholipid acyltransferase family protein n=1 Tax=Mucilaginibacter daejeonensis TaxID=398049 RepID=UPI001D170850|nr:lysophospholipid acyltransferase family protein [Mucilaginibacter daejeonensis]UEG53232.1 lysophospholipid acyltransferase family protein [Mucilaginibacter daejeonensis]